MACAFPSQWHESRGIRRTLARNAQYDMSCVRSRGCAGDNKEWINRFLCSSRRPSGACECECKSQKLRQLVYWIFRATCTWVSARVSVCESGCFSPPPGTPAKCHHSSLSPQIIFHFDRRRSANALEFNQHLLEACERGFAFYFQHNERALGAEEIHWLSLISWLLIFFWYPKQGSSD